MAENTIDKVYTVPLRSGWGREQRSKRSSRAMRDLRAFVLKHAKVKDLKSIKISQGVNALIFARGFQKPPSRIKIEVSGTKDLAQVKLPGEAIEAAADKRAL